jgi:polysaccharide chain length determinant protein (PEP-CTERM system associated)
MSNYSILERLAEYRMIFFYRWRFVVLVASALTLALITVVEFLPDIYEGTTTIVAYPRKVPEKYVATTVMDEPSDRLNLLQQEVLSYTRLLEVINKFGLYGKIVQQEGRDAAIQLMRKQIKIQTNHAGGGGASAFTLTFTGDNPRLVAAVANELANSFILKNLSNRQQQVQGTTDFLSGELETARSGLESQETQLRIYRMSHLGQMPEQMSANLQAVGQLQVQYQATSDKLAQLEEQKLLIESTPGADLTIRSSGTPLPVSMLRSNLLQEESQLSMLLTHMTAAHPDVVACEARIAELKRQLGTLPGEEKSVQPGRVVDARIQVLDKERERLLGEQSAIKERLNSYQAKVDAVPLRQEQLSSLTRDYETAREHYRSLLEKHYSAQMASELESKQDADRFEVLDPATSPDHPTAPNRRLLCALSVFFALIGGLVAAFCREQIDNSIKSDVDLLEILPAELELLGVVSRIYAIEPAHGH